MAPSVRLERAAELPGIEAEGAAASETPEAAPERWDRFWSGSAKAGVPGGDEVPAEPLAPGASGLKAATPKFSAASQGVPPAAPRASAKSGPLTKGTFWSAALSAGAYFAARLPIAGAYKPLVLAGAAFAGAFAVNKLVNWAVTKIGNALGWQPNTTVVVRMVAQIAVWTGGVTTGMAAAGASTAAMLTTAGVGGLAITFAVKDFVTNFIEAVRFLISRPFSLGETIKVGDSVYTVEDMTFNYVVLRPAMEPGSGGVVPAPDGAASPSAEGPSHSLMTYGALAAKPVTLFREFSGRAPSFALGLPSIEWGKLKTAAGQQLKDGLGRSALFTALAIGALPLLGYLGALWPVIAVAVPYLKGAAAVWVSREAGQFLSRLVTRVANSQGWSPQTTMVLRLAAKSAAWAVGGTAALRMFGVTWATLFASLGVTSVALGFAAGETMSNLIQAVRILLSQPFRIGDRVRIGADEGVVTDMNMTYVVLRGDAGTSILLPYSAVKTATLKVFKDYVKAAGGR